MTIESQILQSKILTNKLLFRNCKQFSHIFVRPSLPFSTLQRKRVLRHALLSKPSLLKSNSTIKCIFNQRTQGYELRCLIDNKIDWSSKYPEEDFPKWAESFSAYKASFLKSNSDSNSSA